jgi:hypothetical protein
MKKEATSYRLSVDAKQLIKMLSDRLGINETSVIELAVRELAEKKGIKQMYKLQTFEGHSEGYGNTPIHPVGEVVEVNGTLDKARSEAKRIQHEGDPANARRVTIWENGLAKEGGRGVEEVNPHTERNYSRG